MAAHTIYENYITRCHTKLDINEHLPTLCEYASQCDSVAEFGVRGVVSTWAFLAGLTARNSESKRLITVDIDPVPMMGRVAAIAQKVGIQLEFQHINSIHAVLEPGVDMLFIDTWHIYGHLKRELAAHHAKVRKYIIMHDTTVDEIYGESIREGRDMVAESATTGYPVEDISRGLSFAISEFLAEHPEWVVEAVYTNNNGLTILRRR